MAAVIADNQSHNMMETMKYQKDFMEERSEKSALEHLMKYKMNMKNKDKQINKKERK
jgi:hypothetical protein